jgi:protein SCO1
MTEVVRPTVQLGGAFALTDHHGRAVTDRTFLGSFPLIFFGFTHCKVVCPENLSKLSRVLDLLGPLAEHLKPLYVSVDPDRDTPDVMRTFLESRFPGFLGLTGDRAQVTAMKAAYKVYAEQEAPDAKGDYDVPHTAMTFLMNEDGSYRTHFSDVSTAEDIAARLRTILTSAGKAETTSATSSS